MQVWAARIEHGQCVHGAPTLGADEPQVEPGDGAGLGVADANGVLEVGGGAFKVASGRLEPAAQPERGRPVLVAGEAGVECGTDPVRAFDAGAQEDPGPPEADGDAHAEVGVMRGAPGEGRVDVRAVCCLGEPFGVSGAGDVAQSCLLEPFEA